MAFASKRCSTGLRGGHRGNYRKTVARPSNPSLPQPEASQVHFRSISFAPLLLGKHSDEPKIETVEYVGSFNWKDTHDPEVLVPGKPPRWQPPKTTSVLREDGGLYYRDPNSARFPTCPTEPAIRAIRDAIPNFDIADIDVFGCGNTLGSLLSFAKDEERTFRFGIEYIGSSLFLVRKTNEPGELIEDIRGYGHTFPEAYTQWDKDVKGSASHQRIIKYDFAGLKCFVRSESDGYLPDLIDEVQRPSAGEHDNEEDSPEVPQLLGLDFGLRAPSWTSQLKLQHAGEVVPQRALFDLKTRGLRSKRKDVSVESFLHRLWVNQTPNMILAYHTHGKFESENIHIIDTTSRVAEWEAENARALSKLGGLLHMLIDLAKDSPSKCLEIRRIDSSPLEVWSEVPGWSALSDGFKQVLGVGSPQEHGSMKKETVKVKVQEIKEEDDDDDADHLKV